MINPFPLIYLNKPTNKPSHYFFKGKSLIFNALGNNLMGYSCSPLQFQNLNIFTAKWWKLALLKNVQPKK